MCVHVCMHKEESKMSLTVICYYCRHLPKKKNGLYTLTTLRKVFLLRVSKMSHTHTVTCVTYVYAYKYYQKMHAQNIIMMIPRPRLLYI